MDKLKQKKKKPKKIFEISPINVLGFIGFISIFFVFMMFFRYVSIGEMISKESYTNNQEWFWNIVLFLAIMWAFEGFICQSVDFMLKKRDGKQNTRTVSHPL